MRCIIPVCGQRLRCPENRRAHLHHHQSQILTNPKSEPVLKPSKPLFIRLVCILRFRRHTVQQGLKRMLARCCNAPIFLHPFRFLFRTTCTAGSSFEGVQLLKIPTTKTKQSQNNNPYHTHPTSPTHTLTASSSPTMGKLKHSWSSHLLF